MTAAAHAQVGEDWSRCHTLRRPPGPSRTLLAADSRYALTTELRYSLVARLVDEVVDHAPRNTVLLHAAAVSDDQGRVVGLVAGSGVGKTTAVISLCQESYGYVTDELLVVGARQRVTPLPKPLCVVRGQDDPVKDVVGPDAARLRRHPQRPLTLAGVLVLDRLTGGPRPHAVAPTPASLLWQVTQQQIGTTRHSRPIAALASRLGRVPMARASYQDSGDLRTMVAELLLQPRRRSPYRAVAVDQAIPSTSGYHRAPWTDAVVAGGEVVLLRAGELHHLGPVATAAWRAATGASATDIDRLLTRRFGPPPDAAALSQLLDSLVAAGLLVNQP